MSINIEEERVAFKKWFDDHSKDWPFRNPAILQTAKEGYWEPWLAAKKHAAEMARKGCVIQYDGAGDWWIVIPGVMRQGTYKSKQEAEQRAVREGLRIDTPKTEFLDVY